MSIAKLMLLFFGGLGVLGFMLVHPIGPALFLFAMTPFEGLLYILFGFVGNLINLVPFFVFLVRPPKGGLVDVFVGTRVQRAAGLMVLGMMVSFLIVIPYHGPAIAIKYMAFVYLFVIAGILSVALRDPATIPLSIKVYVLSMVFMTLLSAADFYLSLNLFPDTGALTLADASEEGPAHRWRLTGVGGMSPNRFALFLITPLFLSVGWLARPAAPLARMLPLFSAGVLALGLMATVSRSGILGAGVGALLVASRVTRIRLSSLLAIGLIGGVIAAGGLTLASRMGVEEAIEGRFSGDLVRSDTAKRSSRWLHGIRLFGESPLFGVGHGVEETEKVKSTAHATDPHNAYIRHLAWTGLFGFVFLVYFLYVLATTFAASSRGVPDEIAYWKPYFLGSFVAILIMCLFVSYLVERFLFIIAAYAAGFERARRSVTVAPRTLVSPFLESQEPPAGAPDPSTGSG